MNNKRTIYNLFSRIMSMGISFVVTMFITNIIVMKIDRDVYGLYQLSNDFVNYALVMSIALNSMASRFITISYYDKNIKGVNKYFNTIFFSNLMLALSLIVPVLLITYNLDKLIDIPSSYISDVKILFLLMFLNFIISIITSVFSVSTFIKNRIDLDSFRTIESNIIKIILILLVYEVFPPKIWYLGVCVILSNLYVFLRNIRYTRILTPEIVFVRKEYFDIRYVIRVVSSGIWNSFTKISSILLNGLDLLIANKFIGSSAMGILSISKTIPKYIITSMSTISNVFFPGIMIDYAKGDKNTLINTINMSIKINSIFSAIIEVVVIVLGTRIFELWLPNQDAGILQLISIIAMVGYIVIMPLEVLWSVFTAANKVKISSIYLTIESILTLFFVFCLLNLTDNENIKILIIAGVSSAFEIIRGFTFMPLYSAYCLKIPKLTFYKPLFRFLLAFFISLTISYIFNSIIGVVNWVGLMILCICICIATLVICYLVIFNKNEKKEICSQTKALLRRVI